MINSVDSQLGVLLRQTQWLLDDAAHEIPAGRYHPNKRDELAVILEHMADLIRATKSVVGTARPAPAVTIEHQSPAADDLPMQRATTGYVVRPSTVRPFNGQ